MAESTQPDARTWSVAVECFGCDVLVESRYPSDSEDQAKIDALAVWNNRAS